MNTPDGGPHIESSVFDDVLYARRDRRIAEFALELQVRPMSSSEIDS
jgi:hypothetical protein